MEKEILRFWMLNFTFCLSETSMPNKRNSFCLVVIGSTFITFYHHHHVSTKRLPTCWLSFPRQKFRKDIPELILVCFLGTYSVLSWNKNHRWLTDHENLHDYYAYSLINHHRRICCFPFLLIKKDKPTFFVALIFGTHTSLFD